MAQYVYRGNPGYLFAFDPTSPVVLNPGDVVELTAEQAAAAGEDFDPKAKAKPAKAEPATPDAPASDPEKD